MNKLKLFLGNFLVYGFGGIINKLIPFIMVPVVTRLMPNSSYFGINDMSVTIISFGSALAVMGMNDAMYRMFFEKDDIEYKKSICSTAFAFTIANSLIVFVIMLLCRDFIAKKFFGNTEYSYLIYINAVAAIAGATNSIVSTPTRMQNKRKVFLVMNILSPVLSYAISISLLLKGYYIIALPIAAMLSNIFNELIFGSINRKWFNLKKVNFDYLRQLLKIGVPLLPNFLIYWVFNSSDKLMITNLIDTEATGIYSVGAKLGHASQLIYTAFSGGWQFFAFSTMKEKNQVKSNSMIFEYLGVVSFICSMFVFALAKPIYNILFTEDYVKGYIVSPYLFLAPLLQMLFQVVCNQFLVVKKTWYNLFILLGGVPINIFLNFFLIRKIGIEGAAIATLTGYIVSNIVAIIVLLRMKLVAISYRFIFITALMVGFIFFWRFVIKDNILLSTLIAILISELYIFLYRKDIKQLFPKDITL